MPDTATITSNGTTNGRHQAARQAEEKAPGVYTLPRGMDVSDLSPDELQAIATSPFPSYRSISVRATHTKSARVSVRTQAQLHLLAAALQHDVTKLLELAVDEFFQANAGRVEADEDARLAALRANRGERPKG